MGIKSFQGARESSEEGIRSSHFVQELHDQKLIHLYAWPMYLKSNGNFLRRHNISVEPVLG